MEKKCLLKVLDLTRTLKPAEKQFVSSLELKTFENHELEIRISIDGGDSHYPISIVGRSLNDMNGNGHIGILSYHGDV